MLPEIDIEFLGEDLTQTADIQNEINRAKAFINLERWENAEKIYKNLSDQHPESPCGWFGLARVISLDFTRIDLLEKRVTTPQFDKIKQYIEYCEKTTDEFRKGEYQKLFEAYSFLCEKHFAEICRNKFCYVIEALEEAEAVSVANCPQNKSAEQYVIESLGLLLDELVHDKSVDFYNYDYHRMVDISKRFPSIALIQVHTNIIYEFLQTNHYRHRKKNPEYSLTFAIKDHNPDLFKDTQFDSYATDVLRVFPRFMKVLRIKIGDIESVVPQEYFRIVALQYEEAKKREQKVKVSNAKTKKKHKLMPILLPVTILLIALGFEFFTEPSFVEAAIETIPVATPVIETLASIFTTIQDFVINFLQDLDMLI
ncbi:MAG: hypothetical protein IJE93_11075 [Clostridia bacterium]|nr:hypothetical protein [Clostridia bacterium]